MGLHFCCWLCHVMWLATCFHPHSAFFFTTYVVEERCVAFLRVSSTTSLFAVPVQEFSACVLIMHRRSTRKRLRCWRRLSRSVRRRLGLGLRRCQHSEQIGKVGAKTLVAPQLGRRERWAQSITPKPGIFFYLSFRLADGKTRPKKLPAKNGHRLGMQRKTKTRGKLRGKIASYVGGIPSSYQENARIIFPLALGLCRTAVFLDDVPGDDSLHSDSGSAKFPIGKKQEGALAVLRTLYNVVTNALARFWKHLPY